MKRKGPYREGMTPTVYVSADGRRIAVHDMATPHLVNAIRVIRRAVSLTCRVTGAKRYAVVKRTRQIIPCYDAMLGEAKGRGVVKDTYQRVKK